MKENNYEDLLKQLQQLRPATTIQPTPYLEEVSQFLADVKANKRNAKLPLKSKSSGGQSPLKQNKK